MKKALKIVVKILLALIILIVIFLLVMFIYNKIKMKSEEPLLKPLGQMVEVDDHKMCIYTEGKGEKTLVFLSGAGTASPILDFKSLYSLLSDDYKIVVIEKFGYGFSDIIDDERSFKTILRQDKEALAKAGISGPYILCPHSMSGLEAILWAQTYPDEVEAIIGLDMSLPRAYDNFDFEGIVFKEKLAGVARELGLVRFFYSDGSLPDALSKEEKDIYKAIACKIAVNVDVISEGQAIPKACKTIDSMPKPDVPMLMFVSDGKEVGIDKWVEVQKGFAADLSNAKLVELDCGHYVHNYKQEQISGEMKTFIEGLGK
ncbi:MAG: alpha/beta hydrolase [Oscillospiraceae bacterium]|nr:alpha/beta hydrolase [Oscillospiraceae bacterium]